METDTAHEAAVSVSTDVYDKLVHRKNLSENKGTSLFPTPFACHLISDAASEGGYNPLFQMAHISIVTEKSHIMTVYLDKLYSSLPYVRIVLEKSGLSCLDNERIFSVSTYCFPLSFLTLMLN